MSQYVVVFNVGSATLRASVYDLADHDRLRAAIAVDLQTGVSTIRAPRPLSLPEFHPNPFAESVAGAILVALEEEGGHLRACVHRVMQGGPTRTQPAVITPELLEELERLEPKCPLHQPAGVEVIHYIRSWMPALPQMAVFDTSFHLSQPRLATEYALPLAVRHEGLRAYGFHGISCQNIMRQLRERFPDRAEGRVLIAHLGSSCSMTAVRYGTSIASSMGFSTMEGLTMGTRSGHVDPGILLYLLDQGWAKSRLTHMLYNQSGLLGLSGISGDMHALVADQRDEAAFAVAYYCYRAAREAASLICAMEGIDLLVFTGTIGQFEPSVRQRIVGHLGWLGVRLNTEANAAGEMLLASSGSAAQVMMLPTDEEQEMLLQTETLLPAECRVVEPG